MPLIQSEQVFHENKILSYTDLKLWVRSTCIQNWYLQRYIRSTINIWNKTCSFQTLSIVILWKYDFSHILIENYTLGQHVPMTGICRSTLGQLKISAKQLQFSNSNININMCSMKIFVLHTD